MKLSSIYLLKYNRSQKIRDLILAPSQKRRKALSKTQLLRFPTHTWNSLYTLQDKYHKKYIIQIIFLASSRTCTYLGLFKENEEEKDSRILVVRMSRLVNRLLLHQV